MRSTITRKDRRELDEAIRAFGGAKYQQGEKRGQMGTTENAYVALLGVRKVLDRMAEPVRRPKTQDVAVGATRS